jgi:hypothetical protein
VYLSSRTGVVLEDDDDDGYLEEDIDGEATGDKPKRDRYDRCERAGSMRARAALCNAGDIVEEKLYGTELASIGWTCDVSIFTFSSARQVGVIRREGNLIWGAYQETAGWWILE